MPTVAQDLAALQAKGVNVVVIELQATWARPASGASSSHTDANVARRGPVP